MIPPSPTGVEPGRKGVLEEETFMAVNSDLSHVLFTLQPLPKADLPVGVETTLWPGDGTQRPTEARTYSLYEYVGGDNTEPALVGVKNEGPLHGRPHLNEGADLISQCGIFPGGIANAGEDGVGANHHNAISDSGETVFFTAAGEDDLSCRGSQPYVDELFARLGGSRTVSISEPNAVVSPEANNGCKGAVCVEDTSVTNETRDWRDANFEGASVDGTKVFFTSTQRLVDAASQDPSRADGANETNQHQYGCQSELQGESGCNLYLYDFSKPRGERLTDVSAGDSSHLGPEVQGVAALPEDGSCVYFVAKGVLTGTQQNEFGARAQSGQDNLYVYDTSTGHSTFIATLAATDRVQWPADGGGAEHGEPMTVTDDGRFLAFTSAAHLTPNDMAKTEQIFRYDEATDTLERVSIGGEADSAVVELDATGSLSLTEDVHDLHPAISEDGGLVVFDSTAALTAGTSSEECVERLEGTCVKAAEHAYAYREGHIYLIARNVSAPPLVGPSGEDIFFETTDSLVPADTDNARDIYDARVDGGFAAYVQASCSGEGCQGASAVGAAFDVPGSATLTGSGDLVAAVPSVAPVHPPAKPLSRAEKLARALKRCTSRPKHARAVCRRRAQRVYGFRARVRPSGTGH